jgi:hypothetical protein
MFKQLILAFVLLVLASSLLHAHDRAITGVVTQQDRDSRFEDLKIGSRVRIDLTEDEPVTAKTVWLVQSFFKETEYVHLKNSAR